jgi:two-component system chemotaxis response regulator CheY
VFDLKLNVLVVDDMASIRKILIRSLNNIGFQKILEAPNGEEAIKIIKANNPPVGLIISDWNMPVCTGLEFLKRVKADPTTCKIPFIMVTSESDKAQVLEAIKAKVDGYVLKPFTPEDILSRLQEAYKRLK